MGSIPAQAGEPSPDWCGPNCDRVYPRAGGGTTDDSTVEYLTMGLSPRRRGNLGLAQFAALQLRSIPAQAGEPDSARRRRTTRWVYPRAGGGTRVDQLRALRDAGLSPRRRGNPRRVHEVPPVAGSIPAQAGEPHLPLVGRVVRRSIPAQAGEPRTPGRGASRWPVYPRAGGGTRATPGYTATSTGLSPRRRGNPVSISCGTWYSGSIPAQAGEPLARRLHLDAEQVYPRAGGGTDRTSAADKNCKGLSPRRRGNPGLNLVGIQQGGSIPAQAGEPGGCSGSSCFLRVYPRAGGGTVTKSTRLLYTSGLSPRRRGNPRR